MGCVLGGVQAAESTSQAPTSPQLVTLLESLNYPRLFLHLEKGHSITSLQDWLQSVEIHCLKRTSRVPVTSLALRVTISYHNPEALDSKRARQCLLLAPAAFVSYLIHTTPFKVEATPSF